MSTKRRLSSGFKSTHLLAQQDESSDEVSHSPPRRLSSGRRRQSFGKRVSPSSSATDTADQNQIADMYKAIIKLSSENKINAKNSWNLDLINHMDSIIREESADRSNRGINFQKASCTLDASIKIYSHRVDDTWSSSYRILENLSRNEHVEDSDDQQDEDEGDGQRVKARVGTKSASNRHNLTSTIEKSLANINLPAKELASSTADPMFHKMSQVFDEGGAKGMLMTNLRVSRGSSTLVFGADSSSTATRNDAGGEDDGTAAWNRGVAVSQDLLSRCGFSVQELLNRSVCSALSSYRHAVGIDAVSSDKESVLRGLPVLTGDKEMIRVATGPLSPAPISTINTVVGTSDAEYDCGALEMDAGCDFSDDDNDAGMQTSSPGSEPKGKIQWDAVFSEAGSVAGSDEDDTRSVCSSVSTKSWSGGAFGYAQSSTASMSVTEATPLPKYPSSSAAATFLSAMGGGNQWAGARHWKSNLRPRAAAAKGEPVATKPTKKRQVKEKFQIDFNAPESLSLDVTVEPKGRRRTDATLMTDAAIEKNTQSAKDGALSLPEDAKITLKDLCRLFQWEYMIVPPQNVSEGVMETVCVPVASDMFPCSYEPDRLAGQNSKQNQGGELIWSEAEIGQEEAQDDDFSHGEGFDECDDDGGSFAGDFDIPADNSDGYDQQPARDTAAVSTTTGLDIQVSGGLLEATRVVEKINIGYATSSKRVNVRKLKHDMWRTLDSSLGDRNLDGEENVTPATCDLGDKEKSSALSFQSVVRDIAQQPSSQQKDASLPFYFICLLHLANEKNLRITDNVSLDDLSITQE